MTLFSQSLISAVLALCFLMPSSPACEGPAFSSSLEENKLYAARFAVEAGLLERGSFSGAAVYSGSELVASLCEIRNAYYPEEEHISPETVAEVFSSGIYSDALTKAEASEVILRFSDSFLPPCGILSLYPAIGSGSFGALKRAGMWDEGDRPEDGLGASDAALLLESFSLFALRAVSDYMGVNAIDEHTLIIGDSISYFFVVRYLKPRGLISDAKYMAVCGMPPKLFFDKNYTLGGWGVDTFSEEFRGLTYAEAVSACDPEKITKVFIMLGTNMSGQFTVEEYKANTDHILAALPNAQLYIQKVPYADEGQVDYKAANRKIEEVYGMYRAEGETRVTLVETTFIGKGHLADGVHLSDTAYPLWTGTIKKAVALNAKYRLLSAGGESLETE